MDNENLKVGINYVDNWKFFKKEGKGLILYGPVGTGKSRLAACIANALIDEDEKVYMRNFFNIVNAIQASFEGRQEYINSLCSAGLLVIDDLGAERDSEFMYELIYNVIDARVNTELPLIVTTNLTKEELKSPKGMWEERIYDRLFECCYPVEVAGKSMRKQKFQGDHEKMKLLLMKELD